MQKILALGIFFGLTVLMTPNITSGQSSSDIEIKGILKKGDYVETNLWFQTTNITFAQGNKICAQNDCKNEFQDVTFNDYGNSRYISGVLKIEDKTNSTANFTTYNYYDLSGTFELQNSKESATEKILNYGGVLTVQQKADFPEKFDYESKVILTEPTNRFVLTGVLK